MLQILFCGVTVCNTGSTINNTAGVNFISVYVLLMCVGLLALEFLATLVT